MNSPSRPGFDRPNLAQLRNRAKDLLRGVKVADPEALARVVPYFGAAPAFKLTNAQTVIAREYGFESWPKLIHSFQAAPPPPTPRDRLFDAIESGEEGEAVTILGENPDLAGAWQRKPYGWISPLHAAATFGRLKVARALVEAGAEIYAALPGGYPPVFEADDPKLRQYLLDVGAERQQGPPTYGCGIDIILAGRLGLLDRVKMHVEKDPLAIYRRGTIGESVLHWPAHNGYVDVVEYLLDVGAFIDADEIGLYGGKPLHWAAEHEPSSVMLLLGRGADPNSRNLMPGEFEGYTPLHMCAVQKEQCVDCAKFLLAAGADPALLDAKGQTPLEIAQRVGHSRMAEFLASL